VNGGDDVGERVIHPAKPTAGIRATQLHEIGHLDVTLKLEAFLVVYKVATLSAAYDHRS